MEGKMEGKTRKVKRLAFFTAAFMAALFLFAGQPHKVFAQFLTPLVSPNGVGDLLVFSYWTTQGRDTLVAIVNPFGGDAVRFVHVRVHEGVGSGVVRDFSIGLSPGDVWTATIASAGPGLSTLKVGNPGNFDGAVIGAGLTTPPVVGVAAPIAAAFGYIEAYTMEGTVPAAGGGDDVIWGVATVVNTNDGFSSSYNATAFTNFNAVDENFIISTGASGISQALAREGGVDKEILLVRYVSGGIADAVTQVVLSFPTGNQPIIPAPPFPPDPVSVFFFDEDEHINFSPRSITLSWEVNVCTIAPGASGFTEITCLDGSGFDVVGASPATATCPAGTFCEGWVRIINTTIGVENEDIDTPPATRFPVIGTVFSSFTSGSAQYDQSFPLQWAAVVGSGGIGGAACRAAPALCPSYNIASAFAPWFLPPLTPPAGALDNIWALTTPGFSGLNTLGALPRTGTLGQ